MSLERKCDRCGKLYEAYNISDDAHKIRGLKTLKAGYYSYRVLDLCPECFDALTKCLKKK